MFQERLRALTKKRAYGAFTLVELVVVITILAILATIGFLALSWYTEDADDARIEANVRSIFTAITAESAVTGNSPRYYVIHDPNYALSGWVVAYDGTPTTLTGWEWNEPNTNYSAGNPDYAKLRLNGDKFKVTQNPFKRLASVFVDVSAYESADPKALLAWAAEVSAAEWKTPRTRSLLQIAAIKHWFAEVSWNFPTWLTWSVSGLIRDTSAWASETGALVDELPMGTLKNFNVPIIGNDATWRNWEDGSYAANCDGYRNPVQPKTYEWQTGSGTYLIDPDGTAGNPAYKAYCDMSTDGGGWTLLMRFANDTGLAYGASHWTAGTTLNPASLDAVSNTNAVFDTYVNMPLSTVRWCRASWSDCVTAPLPTAKTGLALFGGAQTSIGSISRTQWVTLFPPNYTNFPNCNAGNVNVTSGLSYMRIRFGIAGNNESDCSSSDNAWGFGLYSTYSGWSCGAGLLNFHAGVCTQATIWGK